MMISPGVYVGGLKKKSYLELIDIRDRLIRELRSFEKPRWPEIAVIRNGGIVRIRKCGIRCIWNTWQSSASL